ncbi:hypothetical protein C0993_007653 [Termitomyces sp. T159_Od127]|nr:hypothetical protein C0993_007653 [Termitomyces sp. T159_Od127]
MSSRICAKKWCHQELPENYQWKNCDHCQQHDSTTKRAQRQRASEKKHVAPNKENKRPHDTTQQEELDELPPLRRQRHEETAQTNGSSESTSDSEEDSKFDTFESAEELFAAIRTEFCVNTEVKFFGAYKIDFDALVSFRDRVRMISQEIWKVSGYRFIVRDHKRLKSGHRTRYWCSQDADHKKKSKKSQDSNVKHRDNVGMKRFTCHSHLIIACYEIKDLMVKVTVQLKHDTKHVTYTDVNMPEEALAIVHEHVEWLTPVAMVGKVQATFPEVTAAQIHAAWSQMSQLYWRRDDSQLLSASKLLTEYLDDVDVFSPIDVPNGVELLCWGMKKIAQLLRG